MGFLISQTSAGSQNYKTAVRAASAAHVALTGVDPLILGGVALNNKDRVLLKDQSPSTQNGIYVYTVEGGVYTLSRSADANTDKEVVPNMIVPVSEGTFADTAFQLVTNGPIVLGTTALTFGFLVEQYTDQDAIDAVLNNVELADFSDFYTTGIRSNVRYVNDGELDIQAAIDAVGAEQGKAIYLSPGSYGGATVTVTDKVNLRIIGPATTSGSHLCELSGGRAMTISGATSTRIGLMNFEIEGGLTITGTQGRHYLRDMILGGLVISGSTSNFLVFQNCSFTGPVSVNVPLGTLVYFIQCDFGNQTVTNTSVVPQQVIFNNCAGFNSLPTGTLLGQSVLAAGASQVNSDKVLVADGSAATPSLSFANESIVGIYRDSNTVLGLAGEKVKSLANTLEFGPAMAGSSVIVNFTHGGDNTFFQINGTTTFVQTSRGLYFPDSTKGLLAEDSSYSSIGVRYYPHAHSPETFRFWTLSNRYQVHAGKHADSFSVPGGTISALRPDAQSLYFGSVTANNTTTLTYTPIDTNSRIQQELIAGVGNYLQLVKSGEPTLVCKITAVLENSFVLDQNIPSAYSGATLYTLPSLMVLRNNDGSEALEVDYKGDTKIKGALALKSAHAQVGVSNIIPVPANSCYIGVDCSTVNGGAKTVLLPPAATCKPGQQLVIKDESGAATTNNISINANGSDLIDGNASESLVVNYESITLICNGVDEWFII